MLIIDSNIEITNEIKLLKEIFNKIVTDEATLRILDFNLFLVEIRRVKLLFDINYTYQDFRVYLPLKIRKEDERFFNYLCGYFQTKNIKVNYIK